MFETTIKRVRHRIWRISLTIVFTFLCSIVVPDASAQTPDSAGARTHPSRFLWQGAPGNPPQTSSNGTNPAVRPRRFSPLYLDRTGLAGLMTNAPREFTSAAARAPVVISLPTPEGGFERFAMSDSPVMEDGLAAKHPDIRTYRGRGLDSPSATIRADITPLGFHASVRGPKGAWYIDPYYQQDDGLYVSYYGRDLPNPNPSPEPGAPPGIISDRAYYLPADLVTLTGEGFQANASLTVTVSAALGGVPRVIPAVSDQNGAFEVTFAADPYGLTGTRTVDASDNTHSASVTYDVVSDSNVPDPPVGDQLRTYRLALLSDPGYATYFGAANVTAAKVTLINRVTQVYEEETSIRLKLIANNDLLNLNTAALMTGTNGPCGGSACYTATQAAGCSGALTRTRAVIGLLIGASNFDIGHIALGKNGGGVASLAVVGGNNKAQGCTGITTPVGDFYAVDYVAHEMGHQFGANHTFNGVRGSCSGGNRTASTSWEPGSGSSIMAYAGICSTDNLQPHSDPYWSGKSLDEILAYTSGAEATINEVQMAVLTNFDGTDSFRIHYTSGLSLAITRGTNFTAAGIETAIEGISTWPAGGTAVVSAVTDTGFTITFGGTLAGVNVAQLSLSNCSVCTGFISEIAQGGLTNRHGTVTATGNSFPSVTVPGQFTIPIQTPFALSGTASDPNGDALTYMWEQADRGGTTGVALLTNAKPNGPLFRQFGTAASVSATNTLLYNSPGENHATASDSSRVFPDMTQILANNTNAETGACPSPSTPPTAAEIDCYSEFLPTSAYVGVAGVNAEPSLHFRLSARDGRGGVNSNAVTLLLATTAGPFLVTSPNTAVTLDGGSLQTVTWNPANTNAAPVNTANVRITASTDGGLTFPYTLNASTPNNGSANVVLPNVATTTARVKVEAVGNVFFDVSNTNFTIAATPPATVTSVSSTAANGTYGVGSVIPITVTFSKVVNITGTPTLTLNDGAVVNYTSGSGTGILTFAYTVAGGQNTASLNEASGTALALHGGTITSDPIQDAILTLPAPGATGSLGLNKSIAIDTTAPTVVSYSVLFGNQAYNVIGSARIRLPWQITGIRVVFSKPITTGDISSLTGVTTTGFSGLGTNTLTWTISAAVQANLSTLLAGSGAHALKDAIGNALAGGIGFSQALKVLWCDVTDDGLVASNDFVAINNARSQPYNIIFDVNGDGVVDLNDVNAARARNGSALP